MIFFLFSMCKTLTILSNIFYTYLFMVLVSTHKLNIRIYTEFHYSPLIFELIIRIVMNFLAKLEVHFVITEKRLFSSIRSSIQNSNQKK